MIYLLKKIAFLSKTGIEITNKSKHFKFLFNHLGGTSEVGAPTSKMTAVGKKYTAVYKKSSRVRSEGSRVVLNILQSVRKGHESVNR